MIIRVIPDYSLTNSKLEGLLTNIHTYKNLFSRIDFKGFKISEQTKIIFEILISPEEISFFYIIPDELEELVMNELNVAYPKATFTKKNLGVNIDNSTDDINITLTDHMIDIKDAIEFELEQHSFLSLKTNLKAEYPLSSFLETGKVLRPNEKVLIQYILVPCELSTNTDFEYCIKEFENEKSLRNKTFFNKRAIARGTLKFAYSCVAEVLDLASLVITNEEYQRINLDEIDNNMLFRNGLSAETKEKANSIYYDTSIRFAVESDRGDLLLKLFQRSLTGLRGDNNLVPRKISKDKLIAAVKMRTQIDKWTEDALCTKELAQLMQLPTKYYQKEYKIKAIDTREINIPAEFTKPGLRICDISYKGRTIPLNFPLDDYDSLCQCWVSIGKMGSGKTTNGENQAIQLLQNGISVFAIDVADGQLIDNIENGLPSNFKKIIDLDFGDTDNPIALSWNELAMVGNNSTSENMLSSQLKNFLNKLARTDQEKLSDRMERFLGAAAKAVFKNPNANLYDVILCVTDREYRHKIIEENKIEGRIKYTLEQLDDDKDKVTGTKSSYITGIMDRLESLLDNEYVANCLLQSPSREINFRKWADEGYFVGIRIPKDKLLDDGTDLLVTYIVSKLWLSILSRDNIPKEERKPCMLILDEPHQFPTVFKELYSIIREMRKWRLGIIILAHEFGDFKGMKNLLKAAGTNYFIYPTSKETYKELLEELQPFELEELLQTKWRHAVVSMRYKDKNICVMGHMIPPLPSKQKYIRSNIYGVNKTIVEEEIFKKTMKKV